MKIFIDSAEVESIRELNSIGIIDGVTTNPSLILKSGRNIAEVTREICDLVDGPVSAEVASTDYDSMMSEAAVIAQYASNVCIKLPLTFDGLRVCKALSSEGRQTNVTLCFSVNQALLAAKAGATFVSPFIGRLEDIDEDGIQLIKDIRTVYDNYPNLRTQILAASVRTPEHVTAVAKAGADVATLPPDVIKKLVQHPLTDKGLATFISDWEKTGQSIM